MSREHHRLGFSRWGRAMRCPGSIQAEQLHPQPESDNRGTKMHAYSETGHRGSLSDFDVYQVRLYHERLEELVEHVLGATGGKYKELSRQKEPRLQLEVLDETIFGYADDLVFIGDDDVRGAIVTDMKTHPTGAYDEWDASWQLKGIALALLQMWPQIKAVVCLAYCPAGQETEVLVQRGDVERLMEDVKRMVQAVQGEKPSLSPGPACRYCPAAGACVESFDYSLTVGDETSGIYRVVGDQAEIINGRAFAERFARIKAAEKILAAEKERMGAVARDAVANGYENKHIALTNGAKRAKITDYEKARDVVPAEIMSLVEKRTHNKWSFSDLTKAAKEAFPDHTAKALKARLEELLDGNLKYSVDRPSVKVKGLDDE